MRTMIRTIIALCMMVLAPIQAAENPYQPLERTVTLNPIAGYQWAATPHGREVGFTGDQALRVNQHDRQQAHIFTLAPNSALRLTIGSMAYAARGTVPGATVRFVLAFDGAVPPLDSNHYMLTGGSVSDLQVLAVAPTVLAMDVLVTGMPGEALALSVAASDGIVDDDGRALSLGQALEIPIYAAGSIAGHALFAGHVGPIADDGTAQQMDLGKPQASAPVSKMWEVLLAWEADSTPDDREAALTRHGLQPFGAPFGAIQSYLVSSNEGQDSILARLNVESAWVIWSVGQPAQLFSDNPLLPLQWDKHHIGIAGAWELTTGNPAIRVGVIDSGIDLHHAAFVGRIHDAMGFTHTPISLLPDTTEPSAQDQAVDQFRAPLVSHGTHVAGILGAGQDWGGTVGAAPSISLVPVRVIHRGMPETSLPLSSLFAGLVYVGAIPDEQLQAFSWYRPELASLPRLSEPVAIVNMSIGTRYPYTGEVAETYADILELVAANGVTIIAATGNDNDAIANGDGLILPAGHPDVIAVAATGIQMQRSSFSNFGEEVFIAAPGGERAPFRDPDTGIMDLLAISSPNVPLYGQILAPDQHRVDRKQANWAPGTSMAAPQVAGVAALMLSVNPTLTTMDIRTILAATALDLGEPGKDVLYGHGLVRADRAVRMAQHWPDAPPPAARLTHIRDPFIPADAIEDEILFGNIFGDWDLLGEVTISSPEGHPWWLEINQIYVDESFDRLRVTITDRAWVDEHLDDGLYVLPVSMSSEHGGNALVQIRIVVQSDPPDIPDSEVSIFLVDNLTRRIIDERHIPSNGSHPAYQFTHIPPGHYTVVAGTDFVDNDRIDLAGSIAGKISVTSVPDGQPVLHANIIMITIPDLIAPNPIPAPESNQ